LTQKLKSVALVLRAKKVVFITKKGYFLKPFLIFLSVINHVAHWSSREILASGARGPAIDSRMGPYGRTFKNVITNMMSSPISNSKVRILGNFNQIIIPHFRLFHSRRGRVVKATDLKSVSI
jgi:hypothetical protein